MAEQAPLVWLTVTSPLDAPKQISISRDTSVAAPSEPVDDTPYSYEYTARHDGGTLPPLRVDNMYGHLVDALREAKASTDAYLLQLVALEAGNKAAPPAKVSG